MIYDLYNGEVRLEFNEAAHRYWVLGEDDTRRESVPSVTTVCGVIDKSAALTQWAANSVLSVVAEAIKPGVEYSEIYLEELWKVAKYAHRDIKEEAAAIGTQAHGALEQYFKFGEDREVADERVANCVAAAKAWLATHSVQKVEIEKRIYSRIHRFSGTLDKLAYVDGVLALVDWKSSKGIYPEHRFQTAAYVAAYEEERGVKVDKRYLIQLGKHDGEFHAHEFDRVDFDMDWRGFLGALQLWRALKEQKDRARELKALAKGAS